MKKLLFVLLAAAMLFGCQKKDQETTPQYQDVSFNATEVLPEVGSRSMDDWICKDEDPTHAWVAITYDGVTTDYYPELFDVDGILYTQSIKFPVGDNYCIQDFVLFKDGNANGTYEVADDITTHGTPHINSDYAGYVTNALPYCFDVDAFEKEEIPIEVLCFEDVDYEKFGFDWFAITEIELSGFCFFGDICLNGEPFTPADFNDTEYGTGLGVDIPAIMKILVYKDGVLVPNSEFNNELDQSEPLCAYYYDDPAVDNEVFTFELWILVPECEGVLNYQLFDTFTSIDDGPLDIDVGDDNLMDFVVGNCGYEADVIYGHYEWLVNRDFFDAPNEWLVTNDPNAGPIYRWNARGSGGGFANIASPIAYFLNEAGYKEQALLGFQSILHDTPLITGGVGSASIYGLLSAYHETGNTAYLTAAQTAWPLYMTKYPNGSATYPRPAIWGYDYFQVLLSVKMAADEGFSGAAGFLTTATAQYLSYVTGTVPGFVLDDYQRIFINAIANHIGIGTNVGTITWVPYDPNANAGDYDLQAAAYGLMGGSWASPDVVKTYMKAQVCTGGWDPTYNPVGVSEAEAEGIYALGL